MLTLLCCLCLVDEPVGVFVHPQNHGDRIEFVATGVCFDRRGKGTWSQHDKSVICNLADREPRKFAWTGQALIDEDGNTWLPRLQALKPPVGDLSRVTLEVVDSDTGKPIKEFAINYQIVTQYDEHDPLLVRPLSVKNEDGRVVLLAPDSCEISFRISGKGILGGYGSWRAIDVKRADKEREFTIPVVYGEGVAGQVVDAATGQPIAGARVSPVVFTPPLFMPDRDASVVTNEQGRFELRGRFDCGIHVWHDDYQEFNPHGFAEPDHTLPDGGVQIRLKPGLSVQGHVQTPDGDPLSGVKISDGTGKTTRTDSAGDFHLRGLPGKRSLSLSFSCEGFLDRTVSTAAKSVEGLVFTLQPMPWLLGTVRDANGQTVPEFTVAAGCGKEPSGYRCSTKRIQGQQRFELPIDASEVFRREGVVWVAVSAPGYAVWEKTIDVWEGGRGLDVRLTKGQSVLGSVNVPPKLRAGVTAMLQPVRSDPYHWYDDGLTQRQAMMRQTAAIDANQRFDFHDVAPGQYTLSVYGPDVSPVSMDVTVKKDLIHMPPLTLKPRGMLHGMIKDSSRDDGVWAFAEGHIRFRDSAGRQNEDEWPHLRPIAFRTDENGRFRVPRVPVGPVSVEFHYHMTADIIDTHAEEAIVRVGEITEVIFGDEPQPDEPQADEPP